MMTCVRQWPLISCFEMEPSTVVLSIVAWEALVLRPAVSWESLRDLALLTAIQFVVGLKLNQLFWAVTLSVHLLALFPYGGLCCMLLALGGSAIVILDHPTRWYVFPFPNVVLSILGVVINTLLGACSDY